MAIPQETSDREWPEVKWINGHAINMRIGFLGVKGLGVAVMTWATVVLLGGFVSVLQKKDFWSLTAITLFELAGTFDLILADRVGGYIWSPFLVASDHYARIIASGSPLPQKVSAFGGLVIELQLNSVKKCIEVVLFVLGLYISTCTSLWRLIVHDYGKADGGANLKPALDVLYKVAVVQGALFLCMNCYSFLASKAVVRLVGRGYNLDQTNLLVSSYLEKTVAGCKLDSSFTKGRNLVTYAVDLLMESKSPKSYMKEIREIREFLEASLGTNREAMVKQLLTDSVSSSHIVRKLLRIMHPRSRYNPETREHAAGIVMFFVDEVRLEEFPGAIQSISSLLDPCEEYPWLPEGYHRDCFFGLAHLSDQGDWLLEIQQIYKKGMLARQQEPPPFSELVSKHRKMFLQGLGIFWRLVDDEGNCRAMSNTVCLMSRITAPLISSQLHQEHHEVWADIAKESLPLLCKFMAIPGEAGAKLRRQISSNCEATIRALQGIVECEKCNDKNVQLAIAVEILLDLAVDTSSVMACRRCSGTFILALVRIFLVAYNPNELKLYQKMYSSIHWMKKRSYIRMLAREKLVSLSSQSQRNPMFILRAGDESTSALRDMTSTLLEHLCSNYTSDGEYLKSLKEAVVNAMPKVLTEILGCGSTRATTQAETEANKPRYSATDSDLEEGPALRDNGQKTMCYSHQQQGEDHGDNKFLEALLSLYETLCQKLIITDPDLARLFDEIASKICSEQGKPIKALTLLMEEAREILKKKE